VTGIVITIYDAIEPGLVEAHLTALGASNIQIQEKLNIITCDIPGPDLLSKVQAIIGVKHAREEQVMQNPPIPPTE